MFGVPAEDDPDPFGVKALEAEGLVIREAGTHRKASAEAFEFKPSPTSPVYNNYRKSIDSSLMRKEWRNSQQSLSSSVDRGTQTDEDETKSPRVPSPKRNSDWGTSSPKRESHLAETHPVESPKLNGIPEHKVSLDDARSADGSHDEYSSGDESDVEIITADAVAARPSVGVVNVPKRVPPALPPRNPGRVSMPRTPTSEDPPTDSFEQVSLTDDAKHNESAHVESKSHVEVTAPDEPSALATSAHNAEDQFHSMPPSPANEKQDDVMNSFQ